MLWLLALSGPMKEGHDPVGIQLGMPPQRSCTKTHDLCPLHAARSISCMSAFLRRLCSQCLTNVNHPLLGPSLATPSGHILPCTCFSSSAAGCTTYGPLLRQALQKSAQHAALHASVGGAGLRNLGCEASEDTHAPEQCAPVPRSASLFLPRRRLVCAASSPGRGFPPENAVHSARDEPRDGRVSSRYAAGDGA
jgi:hypothetical protein